MNYGPLIFLAAFFALSSSWFGYVLLPQVQLGRMQPTNAIPSGATYPVARPGLAREGLEVYRANGCAACHSQQVVQTGTAIDVVLLDIGTNRAALVSALQQVNARLSDADTARLLTALPETVLRDVPRTTAEAAVKTLNATGGKASLWMAPYGPDIARGWGKRHSVAEDFLYDYPVMLGLQRVGPDLADVGTRQPDPNWHLRHLYAPGSEVPGSSMPPYRYLFEKRRLEPGRAPEPAALELRSEPGYEIVPKPEAKALVAYLQSLREDVPLFVAPLSVASAPPASTNAPAGTNAPAVTLTNAPSPAPTNAPGK